MKKKIFVVALCALALFGFVGCGKSKINLNDYLIEKRENLFTANDTLYSVSFSTGTRECEYNFDGIVNEHVPFGVLTLKRNENLPLSNDTYTYIVTINDQTHTGFLEKTDNYTCSADLEVNTIGDEKINVQISFTGYTFNQDLTNTSASFNVDGNTALSFAQKELKTDIENLIKDKNQKIEVVMKLMKDYSTENLEKYYWYVGIISTNGNTMGILIDANSGDIIAKKV